MADTALLGLWSEGEEFYGMALQEFGRSDRQHSHVKNPNPRYRRVYISPKESTLLSPTQRVADAALLGL